MYVTGSVTLRATSGGVAYESSRTGSGWVSVTVPVTTDRHPEILIGLLSAATIEALSVYAARAVL